MTRLEKARYDIQLRRHINYLIALYGMDRKKAERIAREALREKKKLQANPASALRANWQPAMIRRLRNGRVQIKIRPAATARRRARSRGRSKR